MRTRALVLGAALVAAALLVRALLRSSLPIELPTPRVSLLAVGDTGTPPGWIPALDGQRIVARGLEQEDRRIPADALVLLGDNFYYEGLDAATLTERIRENVVAPYCRFVALTAPRSAEVRGACPATDPDGHRPAIYAVLGNHDTRNEESRRLETEAIPAFVSNWMLPQETARTVELEGGVSLILFDSNAIMRRGDLAPLREALRASRGPWRILVAHQPIGTTGDRDYDAERGVGAYGIRVQRAIRKSGVEVQLMLAAHEHNLQILELDPPGPRLVVVAGSGSRPRKIATRSAQRLFGYEGLGFARVDLIGAPGEGRLLVTLFASSGWRSLLGLAPEVLARWSVTRVGGVFVEPLSVRLADAS
jgi:Calcineurin-like phosphoesterase